MSSLLACLTILASSLKLHIQDVHWQDLPFKLQVSKLKIQPAFGLLSLICLPSTSQTYIKNLTNKCPAQSGSQGSIFQHCKSFHSIHRVSCFWLVSIPLTSSKGEYIQGRCVLTFL
ncbi:uncharacterized protein C8R40DRAFT_1121301 [Lentinula edodes]|uniref:uncharacterized protein n=1 Tax=Lentinula edodes TaxID=5353 RepID=UPI001E8D5C54|nr:uncharacterized protein C8R40DRAFT_1121301 [Lentinula edodes]KAH7871621.1 hypothetical protein C8R40DRAFT_1121301 [Lentinula edodes]